jgi:hypothetical protein
MALENTSGRLCWWRDEASVSQVAVGHRTDRGGIDGDKSGKDSRYLFWCVQSSGATSVVL